MMKSRTLGREEVPYIAFLEPDSLSKTDHTIKEFMFLPVGWHYGDGGPISGSVCVTAFELNRYAVEMGLSVTEAFPGINGEIMVSIYPKGHVLDFTIYPNGLIRFRHEINDEEVESEDNLTWIGALQKLNKFGNGTWNSSDSPTPSISVGNQENSKTLSSQIAKRTKQSPLSTRTVPWEQALHFAST